LDGRVLPPEKIIFGRREITTDARCDWTRACSNEEVVRGVPISNWMCVYPAKREDTVAKFAELAIDVGRKIGVRMDMPITVPLRDDKPDTYYNEIKKNIDSGIQMIVIVLPMLSDSRYTRVKRLCCIENSIPSQVIVLKTISKPDNVLRTVAQKIVLQMNVKLGGELWRLSIPIKKMMIVGIDVYHKIDKKYQSIAGFVSSMNHDQTRWYSRVCFQMTGQELADSLKVAFAQSLKKYQEVNGFLPDKIFVFRDGVSDGQIPYVTDHEVAQLKSCFSNEYCPSMSVIVVQKRISTRVFAQGPEHGIINPKPGAIVDTGVTSKDMFDFFIVSQHVSQGTVTPTHYVVAYDDTNYKPDYLQRLSYKMTHMYYNWSGTIRVPAPCQVIIL
jgi:aubergine-like protein